MKKMATIEIKDTAGKKVGTADVSDAVFGIEPHTHAMHQVVRSQMAARRAGTHSTKNRSAVRGGGRKPWRQKGTGRARAGTIRAPQWKGGGVVFGPSPRSYAFKVPNKVVKLAMRSALSAKTQDGVLYVVDELKFEKPSTKDAAKVLDAFGIEGRVTIVVGNEDDNAVLSFRNLPQARVITVGEANTYDIIDNTAVLFTQPALAKLEGVLV
jgi:large subunit ribosomal protein L4